MISFSQIRFRSGVVAVLLAAGVWAPALQAGDAVTAAPAAAIAQEDPDTPRARALLASADQLFAAEKYDAARDAYRKLVDSYPSNLPLEPVLVTLRELARRYASGEASALRFKKYEAAIDVYQLILRVAPAGTHAPADLLELARLQTAKGEPELALVTYRDCAKRFPLLPEAGTAQLDATRLLITTARYGDGDGTLIRQARSEVEQFLRDFPADSRRREAEGLLLVIEERQGDRMFQLGKFYLRKYSYRPAASRRYLNDVVRTYPNTKAAVAARKLLGHLDIVAPAAAGPGGGGAAPGGIGGPGASSPRPPARKPEPATPLAPKPGDVQKYLLPLEDYSRWLPRPAAAKEEPKP